LGEKLNSSCSLYINGLSLFSKGSRRFSVEKIACLNRKLYYHNSKELPAEELEATYHCPVEMIAHGIPHRILKEH